MNEEQKFVELVAEFASQFDEKLIFGVPVALLTLIITVFAVYVARKRRRDSALLNKQIDIEGQDIEATDEEADESKPQETGVSWIQRMRAGLAKTRESLSGSLSQIMGGKKLDAEVLEQVHEALYRADLGVKTCQSLVDSLKKSLSADQTHDWEDIQQALQKNIAAILSHPAKPLNQPQDGPMVILVIGVNGVGKTTSIGKLACFYKKLGKSVMLCAADTYRAAAIEQLQVWGERNDIPVIKHQQGADPAAVTFDAIKSAKAKNMELVLIDTAGRLHNKTDLMNELAKINKVIGRELPGAPHESWLVIDATTGQNAFMQLKAFQEVVNLSGLIVTKLDGTAKGGVIIGACDQFKLPVQFIGIGEKIDDIRPFDAEDFAKAII